MHSGVRSGRGGGPGKILDVTHQSGLDLCYVSFAFIVLQYSYASQSGAATLPPLHVPLSPSLGPSLIASVRQAS